MRPPHGKSFTYTPMVSVFELIIRAVGGLLSAHALTLDELYLQRAEELVQRIEKVFHSPSGIPFAKVSLGTGLPGLHDANPAVLSEFGTMQMELRYLSKATNNKTYAELGDRILDIVRYDYNADIFNNEVEGLAGVGPAPPAPSATGAGLGDKEQGPNADGAGANNCPEQKIVVNNRAQLPGRLDASGALLPTQYTAPGIAPTQVLNSAKFGIAGQGDSYYEYLLKLYLQDPDDLVSRHLWLQAFDAINDYLIDGSGNILERTVQGQVIPHFGHLSCFYPGMLALTLRFVVDAFVDPKIIQKILGRVKIIMLRISFSAMLAAK